MDTFARIKLNILNFLSLIFNILTFGIFLKIDSFEEDENTNYELLLTSNTKSDSCSKLNSNGTSTVDYQESNPIKNLNTNNNSPVPQIIPATLAISNANCEPSPSDFIISEQSPGMCIIFNFEQFNSDHLAPRHGSRIDVNSFKATFENFYCQTEVHSDCNKDEILREFERISQTDYSGYSCIVICISSHGSYGKIFCRDECSIETRELINLIVKNESLKYKPKLIFINSCQTENNFDIGDILPVAVCRSPENAISGDASKQSEEDAKSFPPLELFVFASAYPGLYSFRNSAHGTWFIYELCQILDTYHHKRWDLFRMATLVIKQVKNKRAYMRQIGSAHRYEQIVDGIHQIPVFSSNLSELLLFKSEEQSLRLYPDRGRLLILNCNALLDLTPLQSAYVDLEYLIKSYNYKFLDYKFDDIRARESKNSTANCNCLVFSLFSEELQTFLTNGQKRFPTLADVSSYFHLTNCSEEAIKQLSKYYFINSSFSIGIRSTDEQTFSANFYYFESGKQTFVSCNALPVNHTAQILSCYNFPKSIPLDYSTFLSNVVQEVNNEAANDSAKLSFNQLLMSHLSNTIKFDNFDCVANLEHTNYRELVYDTRGVTAGNVVMVYHADDPTVEREYDECSTELTNLFKFELMFNYQRHQIEQTNTFDSNYPAIKNAKNCIVLFIFAECKNDESQKNSLELIFEQNRKICFTKLIDSLKTDDLVGKPKLIFIQNLVDNDIKIDFDLPEDFLVLISPAEFKSNFVEQFCKLLKEHYSEYDLMSIVHKLNILQGKLQFSIKSKLSKTLFFKKRQTKLDLDIIKNDDLFYRQDKGRYRCHIMRYVKDSYLKTEAEKNTKLEDDLKESFEKVNFETSIQEFNNDSLKRMLDNEMLQNHYSYDGFFVIMILDNETDSKLIMELLEHLTSVECLVGKPKVLFLLGPMNYQSANLTLVLGQLESYTTDFRLSKHADLMVFQSAEVEKTINSICTNFTEDNVNKYDLIRLLLMVSSGVNSNDQQAVDALEQNSEGQNSENQNQPNQQDCQSQICTNSTLTRLISLRTNLSISLEELQSNLHLCEVKLEKGKCYIFNYEFFENGQQRPGSEEDQKKLIATFEGMGFVVEPPVPDMSVDETNDAVDKINCEEYDCLVVCFLTHGKSNNDIQCNNGFVNQNDIINRIAARPELNKKPKFFFSQTCRGDGRETSDPSCRMSTDILTPTESPLAIHSDLFVFYPTFESHESHRDKLEGTWFIQELCNQLDQNSHRYDIFTIAAIVTREVSRKNENWSCTLSKDTLFKQTPTFYSTLKHAYFFPKVLLPQVSI